MIEQAKRALALAAYIVLRHGAVYAPYIDRLERELKPARKNHPTERAKRILHRRRWSEGNPLKPFALVLEALTGIGVQLHCGWTSSASAPHWSWSCGLAFVGGVDRGATRIANLSPLPRAAKQPAAPATERGMVMLPVGAAATSTERFHA